MDSFAYDKENGLLKNVHSNFLNFFCGIVIKKSIPYTSEKYLDQEKAELDRYLAKVEAKKKTQEQYFKMLKDKAFEDWKKDLSQEEINKLSPPSEFAPEGSNFQAMLLESYFNENIYKGNDEQPAEL